MISRDEAETLISGGYLLLDRAGQRVGVFQRVFLDDYTGWPSFATVTLDQNTPSETFVALHEADLGSGTVQVPYDLEFIRAAPQVGDDAALTTQEEDALFDYYGVPIDGVVPSVEHLGSVMDATATGDVTETPTDQLPVNDSRS